MPTMGPILGYLGIVALVAALTIAMGTPSLGGDPATPQLVGWSGLQSTLTNPLGSLAIPSPPADPGCSGFDIGCQIGRIGSMIFWPIQTLGAVIIWLFTTLINLGAGMFGILTLTFAPALPIYIQAPIWALTVPMTFFFLMTVIAYIRGNEG